MKIRRKQAESICGAPEKCGIVEERWEIRFLIAVCVAVGMGGKERRSQCNWDEGWKGK